MTDWLQIFVDVEKKKPILVNLQELIKSRALFQANSGGGKSHAMRKGIETAHGKVQQIIIDPEGEFHTLREKYSFLLVGKGSQADIQIDPKHAALLARRIMETQANVIIDLYELNPFERIRFVKLFCDALVNLPKTLWHQCLIWLDEIHVFAPESKSGRSESLAAVAALASRGRKRGYGLIGATQRISKLSKDVAAELNTKFIGRCSLDVDRKRAGEELGIKDTTNLRKLKHEFHAFGPAISDDIVLVKAYETETSHEEIGTITSYTPANKGKIENLMKNFSELPQEVELDLKTMQGLQTKIQELSTKLRQSEKLQPKQDPQALEKAFQKGLLAGEKESKEIINTQLKYIQSVKKTVSRIKQRISESQNETENNINLILQTEPDIPQPKQILVTVAETKPNDKNLFQEPKVTITPIEGGLTGPETKILTAIAQRHPLDSTKQQVSIITGYSIKSSGFTNNISHLNATGLIVRTNGSLQITSLGLETLGEFEPLQTDPVILLNFWCNKVGNACGKILRAICESHPNPISKQDVSEKSNYSITSSGFNNNLAKLNSSGLIHRLDAGMLKASKEMFPDEF